MEKTSSLSKNSASTRIVLYKEEKIYLFNGENTLIRSFNHNVVYLYKTYFTNEDKILFRIVEDEVVKILQLKKRVWRIFEFDRILYIVDVYGDIYKLIEEKLFFVCGSLCSIQDIHIHSDRLYILDKYKRIRVSQTDGKILNYEFDINAKKILTFKDKITYIRDNDSKFVITEDILDVFLSNSVEFIVTDKFIYFIDGDELRSVAHSYMVGNVNIGSDGICYRMSNDKLIMVK